MTCLHLLVADLHQAELCMLGGKFVVRPSLIRTYLKHLAGLLVILLHSSLTNSSHCCDHQADPWIQSP
jgi:hypothetical protein